MNRQFNQCGKFWHWIWRLVEKSLWINDISLLGSQIVSNRIRSRCCVKWQAYKGLIPFKIELFAYLAFTFFEGKPRRCCSVVWCLSNANFLWRQRILDDCVVSADSLYQHISERHFRELWGISCPKSWKFNKLGLFEWSGVNGHLKWRRRQCCYLRKLLKVKCSVMISTSIVKCYKMTRFKIMWTATA